MFGRNAILIAIAAIVICTYCDNEHSDEKGVSRKVSISCKKDIRCINDRHIECIKKDNGNIITMCVTKDGIRDGAFKEENNRVPVITVGNYIMGEKSGQYKEYYKGKLRIETVLMNNRVDGPMFTYHKNGRIKSYVRYRNDKRNGIAQVWNENGLEITIGYYKNNKMEGCWREKAQDGHDYIKGCYIDGKREGKFEEWYPVGIWDRDEAIEMSEKKRTADYCDYSIPCHRYVGAYKGGVRDGVWTEEDDAGRREIAKRLYKDGKVIRKWSVDLARERGKKEIRITK